MSVPPGGDARKVGDATPDATASNWSFNGGASGGAVTLSVPPPPPPPQPPRTRPTMRITYDRTSLSIVRSFRLVRHGRNQSTLRKGTTEHSEAEGYYGGPAGPGEFLCSTFLAHWPCARSS